LSNINEFISCIVSTLSVTGETLVTVFEILEELNRAADKVIVLHTPEPFGAVGRFYQEFNQVSDDEVKEIMKKYQI
jgi:predicted phosphoribosyltransferase